MEVKELIGDIHKPNNVRPRILILLITIVSTTFVLIMTAQSYSKVAMLVGILLISLDKIFGIIWLANRTAARIPKSKIQTIREFLKRILRFGLYDDYLSLIGTGILIAVIISEICRAVILSDISILAILWNRIIEAIPTDCFLFIVAKIFKL
ncbi:MAG: hypothetical protein WBC40_10960 [Halobacteriota archaeon]